MQVTYCQKISRKKKFQLRRVPIDVAGVDVDEVEGVGDGVGVSVWGEQLVGAFMGFQY